MNRKEMKAKLAERDGLRCAVTGEPVESLDELEIDHLVPQSKGGTSDIDNLILVKPHVNRVVSDDERRRTRLLIQQLRQRQDELAKNEKDAFEREQAYRLQIESQKKELEDFRRALHRDQSEREAAYAKELDAHRQRLAQQEAQLIHHLRDSEKQFGTRLAALEEERAKLEAGIREKEVELKIAHEEFTKEKARYAAESVKRVQENATTYVSQALGALDSASKRYRAFSGYWSIGGVVALGAGIGVAAYFGMVGLAEPGGGKQLDWAHVVFYTFKGLLLIALFVALAKYCFVYSQSFMHEALKSTERKHAINFGQFYLESYGANADWTQIKEAFEHWNISPSSSFVRSNVEAFDPKVMDRIAQLVESVSKLKVAGDAGEKKRV